MRNPFRARWAVHVLTPIPGHVAPAAREVSRHWSRGMAEEVVAELTGRRRCGPGPGLAYVSNYVTIEKLP